jgi:catechol 2,3-dioxygenase-like lactoylglutathione lyase family enzyme
MSDRLSTSRPDGRISRRALLLSVPAIAAARGLGAQGGAKPQLRVRALNHLTLAVSDPKRSLEFYQRLFGMPVQAHQGAIPILRIGSGPQFLALSPAGTGASSISHLCLTVDNFAVDRVIQVLAAHGVTKAEGAGGGLSGGPMKVRVRMRGPESGGAPGGTPELYFADPDGIVVQLQDPSYCGGSGPLGSVCSSVEPAPSRGLIAVKDLSHFTVFVSDGPRSNTFYRELFGFGTRSFQGPTAPTLAVGPGVGFLMFAGAGGGGRAGAPPAAPRAASINHVCLSMDRFNVAEVQKALESVGIRPREDQSGPVPPMRHYVTMRMENRGGAREGTPELYFTDPDGILVQVQDVSYCGGSGYLGNECPKS